MEIGWQSIRGEGTDLEDEEEDIKGEQGLDQRRTMLKRRQMGCL